MAGLLFINQRNPELIMYRIISPLIIAIILCSCGTTTSERTTYIKNFQNKKIVMLPPQPMSDILGITDEEQQFNNNIYIGSIRFSGCIITNPSLKNMRQSEKRVFSMKDEFLQTMKQSVSSALLDELNRKNYDVREYAKTADAPFQIKDIIRYESIQDRNKYPEDGDDNINLPRIIYKPVSLNDQVRNTFLNENCDYLMVPVIEYYYGHNGGWFNDQLWGCPSGLRIACQILVYDVHTGRLVFYFRNYEKKILGLKYQISIPEITRELYDLEKIMAKKIQKSID